MKYFWFSEAKSGQKLNKNIFPIEINFCTYT